MSQLYEDQSEQIGIFLGGLGDMISYKSNPNFLAVERHFKYKLLRLLLGNFLKNSNNWSHCGKGNKWAASKHSLGSCLTCQNPHDVLPSFVKPTRVVSSGKCFIPLVVAAIWYEWKKASSSSSSSLQMAECNSNMEKGFLGREDKRGSLSLSRSQIGS